MRLLHLQTPLCRLVLLNSTSFEVGQMAMPNRIGTKQKLI
jgi:hypothetical protein